MPDYEAGSRCRVKTVAVGSGEALALGADGNADVLLVHSPAAEQQYMAQGHGLTRAAVMHNDFVLLGPKNDPAHAARAGDTAKAFAAIAAAHAPFASRADQSGTNAKELTLWARAGVKPTGGWYIRTGQGMGETLTIASQKQAYTLSDRGTYLATEEPGPAHRQRGAAGAVQPLPRHRRQARRHQRGLRPPVRPVDRVGPHAAGDRPLRREAVRAAAVRPGRPAVTAR